jgi:hypothetical protein
MEPGNIAEAIERERQVSRKLLEGMAAAIRRVAGPRRMRIPEVVSVERNTAPAYALMAGTAVGLLVGYWLRRKR